MKKRDVPRVLLLTTWPGQDILRGTVAYAIQSGWHLDMTYLISGELPDKWNGEGIIIHTDNSEHIMDFVNKHHLPTISMTINNQGKNIVCVDFNNEKIGQMAASYFINLNFKRYAFYDHNNWPVTQLRLYRYKQMIDKLGYSCKILIWDENRAKCKNTWSNRGKWLKKELTKMSKPIALFAVDDIRAIELIEVCRQLKLRIPEDVSILGVGNFPLFASFNLSSIQVENYQLGFEVGRQLERLIQREKPPKAPILIEPSGIIARQSTNMIVTEDPCLARAVRFILDNYNEPISVNDVVRESATGATSLYKLFQKELRKTPHNFLTSIRLENAKRLLRETDLKIIQIADCCGLSNPINLFRVFKRHENIGPQQYRKENSHK